MTISRYKQEDIFTNNSEQYQSVFAAKNINKIRQYGLMKLKFPTDKELANLTIETYQWNSGDRLFRLAHEYYDGRSELWWVIAWFNGVESESDILPGANVMIPLPLERILTYMGV